MPSVVNLFMFVIYGFMLLFGEISLRNEISMNDNNPAVTTSIVGVAAWMDFSSKILGGNVILSVFKVRLKLSLVVVFLRDMLTGEKNSFLMVSFFSVFFFLILQDL
jgi:hypothetical protein